MKSFTASPGVWEARSWSVPHEPGMRLDQLAQAMRGMPRDALNMIRTPAGLRKLVWVKAIHVGTEGTEAGASSGGRYAIILEHDGLEPQSSKRAGGQA
jgi:hypothetical protein